MKSRIFKEIEAMNIYFQYTGTKIKTKIKTKESPKWGRNIPKWKTEMHEKNERQWKR